MLITQIKATEKIGLMKEVAAVKPEKKLGKFVHQDWHLNFFQPDFELNNQQSKLLEELLHYIEKNIDLIRKSIEVIAETSKKQIDKKEFISYINDVIPLSQLLELYYPLQEELLKDETLLRQLKYFDYYALEGHQKIPSTINKKIKNPDILKPEGYHAIIALFATVFLLTKRRFLYGKENENLFYFGINMPESHVITEPSNESKYMALVCSTIYCAFANFWLISDVTKVIDFIDRLRDLIGCLQKLLEDVFIQEQFMLLMPSQLEQIVWKISEMTPNVKLKITIRKNNLWDLERWYKVLIPSYLTNILLYQEINERGEYLFQLVIIMILFFVKFSSLDDHGILFLSKEQRKKKFEEWYLMKGKEFTKEFEQELVEFAKKSENLEMSTVIGRILDTREQMRKILFPEIKLTSQKTKPQNTQKIDTMEKTQNTRKIDLSQVEIVKLLEELHDGKGVINQLEKEGHITSLMSEQYLSEIQTAINDLEKFQDIKESKTMKEISPCIEQMVQNLVENFPIKNIKERIEQEIETIGQIIDQIQFLNEGKLEKVIKKSSQEKVKKLALMQKAAKIHEQEIKDCNQNIQEIQTNLQDDNLKNKVLFEFMMSKMFSQIKKIIKRVERMKKDCDEVIFQLVELNAKRKTGALDPNFTSSASEISESEGEALTERRALIPDKLPQLQEQIQEAISEDSEAISLPIQSSDAIPLPIESSAEIISHALKKTRIIELMLEDRLSQDKEIGDDLRMLQNAREFLKDINEHFAQVSPIPAEISLITKLVDVLLHKFETTTEQFEFKKGKLAEAASLDKKPEGKIMLEDKREQENIIDNSVQAEAGSGVDPSAAIKNTEKQLENLRETISNLQFIIDQLSSEAKELLDIITDHEKKFKHEIRAESLTQWKKSINQIDKLVGDFEKIKEETSEIERQKIDDMNQIKEIMSKINDLTKGAKSIMGNCGQLLENEFLNIKNIVQSVENIILQLGELKDKKEKIEEKLILLHVLLQDVKKTCLEPILTLSKPDLPIICYCLSIRRMIIIYQTIITRLQEKEQLFQNKKHKIYQLQITNPVEIFNQDLDLILREDFQTKLIIQFADKFFLFLENTRATKPQDRKNARISCQSSFPKEILQNPSKEKIFEFIHKLNCFPVFKSDSNNSKNPETTEQKSAIENKSNEELEQLVNKVNAALRPSNPLEQKITQELTYDKAQQLENNDKKRPYQTLESLIQLIEQKFLYILPQPKEEEKPTSNVK